MAPLPHDVTPATAILPGASASARTLSTGDRRADWAEHIVSVGAPSMRVIAMLPDVASEVREAMATFLIADDREALDSSVSTAATVVCNRRL
ncbi:hypothetical protein ACVWWJ_002681 [Luteibacter sp. HA06]